MGVSLVVSHASGRWVSPLPAVYFYALGDLISENGAAPFTRLKCRPLTWPISIPVTPNRSAISAWSRFVHEIVRAALNSLNAIVRICQAGNEHNGYKASLGIALDRAAHRKAAAAGHQYI